MNHASPKHHRINEILHAYWDQLRGGRALPLESDVSIEELKEIWEHCFLVSVHAGHFAYSYLGPHLVEAYGDDITGHEITEALVYPHPEALFAEFKEVTATAQPREHEGEFTNTRGTLVKYRSCVLPLGAHGHPGVAFLLGGMKWKAN